MPAIAVSVAPSPEGLVAIIDATAMAPAAGSADDAGNGGFQALLNVTGQPDISSGSPATISPPQESAPLLRIRRHLPPPLQRRLSRPRRRRKITMRIIHRMPPIIIPRIKIPPAIRSRQRIFPPEMKVARLSRKPINRHRIHRCSLHRYKTLLPVRMAASRLHQALTSFGTNYGSSLALSARY